MILARLASVPGRWIVAGLALHALAAALFLSSTLSSNPERARKPADAARPAPDGRRETGLVPAAPQETARRQPAREPSPQRALEERVQQATTALVQALDTSAYEDQRWLETVREHARALGADARPMLEALLADGEGPVALHVAASELLAALP